MRYLILLTLAACGGRVVVDTTGIGGAEPSTLPTDSTTITTPEPCSDGSPIGCPAPTSD